MRATVAVLCLPLLMAASACVAQDVQPANARLPEPPDHPWMSSVYCSGFYTTQKVSDDLRLVSGEQSEYKTTFQAGDIVFLSKGANQGVKPGDRFSVMRAEPDRLKVPFFKWQEKLVNAMGTRYVDLGQLEVIKVQPNIAIAKVTMSCDLMQRADIVLPFTERPSGPFKQDGEFDKFAPPSGKPTAMVVQGKDIRQATGRWDTVFVNLGTSQGVKVGDYFRIFRYQGSRSSTIPIEKDYQDRLYGFGTNPKRYSWNDLPREVLGEGIVLNSSQNSATVLVTVSRTEIYSGDYVELE